MAKIIYLFLDGFGIGTAHAQNPIYTHKVFSDILHEPLIKNVTIQSDRLVVKSIDARLGVDGIPQSATGQTALFTGINAAALLGHHRPAFPNDRLVELIRERNIFQEVKRNGKRATFANAYSREYFTAVAEGKRHHSVTTHVCMAAQVPLRTIDDYENGEAVYWDITGERVNRYSCPPVPEITPEDAGTRIANLAHTYDLVVFETFLPDVVGHSRDEKQAAACSDTINRFVRSLHGCVDAATTIVITSDHGNFEDLSCSSHTTNPVPLLVFGPEASIFVDIQSIVEVPRTIEMVLET